MFKELWNSGTAGRVTANILIAISIIVALYLLLIAYRKLLVRFGRGKSKKITVKYANVFELKPPYATGTVQFGFELVEPSHVEFRITDLNDKIITTIVNQEFQPGTHPLLFDSTKFKNGMYYYQFISPLQNISKKFIIDN
jgi:hypothetical protein